MVVITSHGACARMEEGNLTNLQIRPSYSAHNSLEHLRAAASVPLKYLVTLQILVKNISTNRRLCSFFNLWF